MTWDPPSSSEPFLVPLTPSRERRARSTVPTPEELLIAREESEAEELSRRKLSPEMRRAMIWLQVESPQRIGRLIDWALPIEEAYIVRRYLLNGERRSDIAPDVGISEQGVGYRLRRAFWRLRQAENLAWDMSEHEIRCATKLLLKPADVELLVVLWACKFSQSRAAEKLGMRWQVRVREAVQRVTRELAASDGRQATRIHRTLVEVQRRKLWTVAPPLPLRHAMRVPG